MTVRRRSIPASFALALYEYLDQHGVDTDQLLPVPRPPQDTLLNADMPIDLWRQLLECAAEHLNDPLLGLHLGQTVIPRHAGVLGYVIMASQNLGEAIAHFHHYQRLIYDVTPLIVRENDSAMELVWDAEHGRPGPLVDETAVTALVNFFRRLTFSGLVPQRVDFINPTPANIEAYTDYFGCPVRFEQPETVISVSADTVAHPLQTSDPAMLTMLEAQADALLARLPLESPLVDDVRRRIGRLLSEQQLDIATVAASMGVSTRTLQRQLAREGTSFLNEVAAVRREMAERYLRETNLGLVDIALVLGYSEHSAFTRSFVRWTGMTPNEFRQQGRRD
ncbi:MAG: AraC family transcriptional regulator [Gammaproteobacteria bacterium]|uniref:AraC family transcriptional regulator n=1 Tax=Marinobacter sp. SBS5 TaxID=3401754 RepID=UPI003AACF2A5|nr:AraC family transcriptional regulator [Gammaproteobacteria bacterium]